MERVGDLVPALHGQLDRVVREGRWGDSRRYMAPMPKLTNQVLGLVAFGNIPRKVSARARAFDMQVIACDPFVSDDVFERYGVERVANLADVFRRRIQRGADFYDKLQSKLRWGERMVY